MCVDGEFALPTIGVGQGRKVAAFAHGKAEIPGVEEGTRLSLQQYPGDIIFYLFKNHLFKLINFLN